MKTVNLMFMMWGLLLPQARTQSFESDKLPIGDPERKLHFCKVELDKIMDTQANTEISFENLIAELSNKRIVMIGETHTNQNHHDVQFEVIKALTEAGKKVVLALEMYNPSQNEQLATWSSGKTDPDTFIEQTDYLTSWGHNYRYYQAIFEYAREKNIPMYGANVERKYASKIGRGGLGALTNEEIRMLPHIDTSNNEHKFLIKVLMQGMDATMPKMFTNMYPAQSLWDCAMGQGAIKAAHEHPDATIIVLAGSGHVIYNLGIGRVIKNQSNLSFASVVPIDIEEKRESEIQADAHGMMSSNHIAYRIVVRSYADYIWGKPEMEREKYPALGISLEQKVDEGFAIKRLFQSTIAYRNGLRAGDIIISVDNQTFNDLTSIKKHLHFVNWDDTIEFRVLREGEKLEFTFRIE